MRKYEINVDCICKIEVKAGSKDAALTLAKKKYDRGQREIKIADFQNAKIIEGEEVPDYGAKFKVGDIVRYAAGPTALMQIEYINLVGGSIRYYGEQYYGGKEGVWETSRVPTVATESEINDWNKRWICSIPSCKDRPGLAGSGLCVEHARKKWHEDHRPDNNADCHGAPEPAVKDIETILPKCLSCNSELDFKCVKGHVLADCCECDWHDLFAIDCRKCEGQMQYTLVDNDIVSGCNRCNYQDCSASATGAT